MRIIKDDEYIENLHQGSLQMICQKNSFTHGTDSILLAYYAKLRPRFKVCDLCAGGGILTFLLSKKHESIEVDAVEIDPDTASRMERSVQLNDLSGRIRVHQQDLRMVKDCLKPCRYDLVICNPPYHQSMSGFKFKGDQLLARTSEGCTFEDVANAAAFLLKTRGRFLTMCPSRRVFEMSHAMQEVHLRVKRLRFVQSFRERAPYLCLIEGVKGAAEGVLVETPLTIYEHINEYTDELKEIYGLKNSEEK